MRSSAASSSSSVAASFSAFGGLARQLLVGLSFSHLPRSAGLRRQQLVEVDRAGAPWALAGLTAMDRPRGLLQAEAHHRLVDGADLLHVQRAVGEPLAVEDEQLFEHAEDDAVGHERRVEALVRVCAATPYGRPSRNG